MSILNFHNSPFYQRWNWQSHRGNILYTAQRLKLATLWPGDLICGRVERLDHQLQAAFIDCGLSEYPALGFMPTKGRHINAGQKLWLEVAKLPRPGKGLALNFVEPARSNEPIGTRRADHYANSIPFNAAQEIHLARHATRIPSGLKAKICVERNVRSNLAVIHQLENSIAFNNGNATMLIEPGNTLTAIDVNGPPTHSTNLAACDTIALNIWRQNLYGLIVVDFIRPHSKEERTETTKQLIAEYNHISDMLPSSLKKPKVEFSTMDHRGLVIIERQRLGINAWDLQAYDPLLCTATDILDDAMEVKRPGIDNILQVSLSLFHWLHATELRQQQWQSHLHLQADENLLDQQWNWKDD